MSKLFSAYAHETHNKWDYVLAYLVTSSFSGEHGNQYRFHRVPKAVLFIKFKFHQSYSKSP